MLLLHCVKQNPHCYFEFAYDALQWKPIKTILNMQSFHLKIINNNKKPYFEETLTENKDNP